MRESCMSGLTKLPPWYRLAWREVWNNRKFSLFFVLNLALGLTGFIAMDAFKASVEKDIAGGSRQLLGGDVVVRCQNRLCSDDEKKIITEKTTNTHVIAMFSMVSANGKSKLADLV